MERSLLFDLPNYPYLSLLTSNGVAVTLDDQIQCSKHTSYDEVNSWIQNVEESNKTGL